MRTLLAAVLALSATVAAALSSSSSAGNNVAGFAQLWRVLLPSQDEVSAFDRLERAGLVRLLDDPTEDAAVVAVPGRNLAAIRHYFRRAQLEVEVLVEDFELLLALEAEMISQRRREFDEGGRRAGAARVDFDLENYHDYEEIMAYLQQLAAEYPNLVSTQVIGQSFEGRDMRTLRVCSGDCDNKPAVWLDGGIHAREWISPASVLYLIDTLVQSLPPEDSPLLELDWHFLPIVNPDGYAYTWAQDRLWRKTRHVFPDAACVGVDGNRNFGFHWDELGSSDAHCASTYHGPEPFSEPELQALSGYVSALGQRLVYYVNHHSYGQLIMYPWGYSNEANPDADDQDRVANLGNAALRAVHNSSYEVGPHFTTIYPASGISIDWAYGAAGVKYAFIVELRDQGQFGFELPPEQIRPTAEELYAFHRAVADEIIAEFAA